MFKRPLRPLQRYTLIPVIIFLVFIFFTLICCLRYNTKKEKAISPQNRRPHCHLGIHHFQPVLLQVVAVLLCFHEASTTEITFKLPFSSMNGLVEIPSSFRGELFTAELTGVHLWLCLSAVFVSFTIANL